MKKFTLLFAMLIGIFSSAWADVTPGNYFIKNKRSGKYAVWKGDATQIGQSSSKQLAAIWTVTSDGKLGNQATSNFYASTTSFTATGKTVYIVASTINNGYYAVSESTTITTANCWDDQGSHTTVGYWKHVSGDAEGTSWEVIPVSDEEVTHYKLLPTYTTLYNQADEAYKAVKNIYENLITSVDQLSSPYTESTEGSLAGAIDKDPSTFWHSAWSGEQAATAHGTHYLQISNIPAGDIQMTYTRRNNTSDQLTSAKIQGVNGNIVIDLGTVNFPYSQSGETLKDIFTLDQTYEAIRILEQSTANTGNHPGCWHIAELQFNQVDLFRTAAPTEAAALKAELDKEITYISQQDIDNLQNAYDAYSAAIPVDYTVSVVGAEGGVIYKENTYMNGQVFEAPVTLSTDDLEAVAVTGYTPDIAIEGQTINVKYYNEYVPALPEDKPYLSIGVKAKTFTTTTSAGDNDHWYIMTQTRDGESPMYDNVSALYRSSAGKNINGQAVADNNERYLVRFIPTEYEGVYNIQFSTGRFIQTTLKTGSAKGAGMYFVYNINGEDTHIGWNKTTNGTTKADRVDNNGPGYNVSFWGSGEITSTGGNNDWSIYPVELVSYTIIPLQNAIANAQTYVGNIGTEFGQYSGLTEVELANAIAAAQQALTSTDMNEINAAIATLNTEVNKLSINLPVAGEYLRIKGTYYSDYIGNSLATNNKYSRTTDADEAIVYFDGTTLRNVSTGKYYAVTSSSWAWGDTKESASAIEFGSAIMGKYTVKCANIYLYDADGYVDRGQSPSMSSANQYNSWILERADVSMANMRISDAGWATFYAPFAVDMPAGVKAYTGEMQDGWIRMNELTKGYIPANTGVVVELVEGEPFESDLVPSAEQPNEVVLSCYTGNTTGTTMAMEVGDYLLQKQNDVVGWYKVEGEGFTLARNRCYLANGSVPAPNQSRTFFGFAPDDATGISSIATEAKTKADGKYMVNGQIVVVKAGKAYNMSGAEIK